MELPLELNLLGTAKNFIWKGKKHKTKPSGSSSYHSFKPLFFFFFFSSFFLPRCLPHSCEKHPCIYTAVISCVPLQVRNWHTGCQHTEEIYWMAIFSSNHSFPQRCLIYSCFFHHFPLIFSIYCSFPSQDSPNILYFFQSQAELKTEKQSETTLTYVFHWIG